MTNAERLQPRGAIAYRASGAACNARGARRNVTSRNVSKLVTTGLARMALHTRTSIGMYVRGQPPSGRCAHGLGGETIDSHTPNSKLGGRVRVRWFAQPGLQAKPK